VIASAALLLITQASTAQATDPCDDPQTQQAMNACSAREFTAADATLNEQWALTVAEMKDLDRALPEGGDGQPGYYDALLAGQRAWLAYRDAECRSESFFTRGGSLQPTLEMQCKTYLTELRTEQLRVLAAGPEGN
jgi:uncharacterized protein YecT (DUF1311 family)